MDTRSLATLPVPSTSFTTDPTFIHPGGDADLQFEFERGGQTIRRGIRFENVRAFRFRSEGHCTSWHVQAYDALVEVSPSTWVSELLAAEHSETWGRWKIRHFLIFLDSAGAYEVAAASWTWLPEEVVQ